MRQCITVQGLRDMQKYENILPFSDSQWSVNAIFNGYRDGWNIFLTDDGLLRELWCVPSSGDGLSQELMRVPSSGDGLSQSVDACAQLWWRIVAKSCCVCPALARLAGITCPMRGRPLTVEDMERMVGGRRRKPPKGGREGGVPLDSPPPLFANCSKKKCNMFYYTTRRLSYL